jgi:hypothetical protein
MNDMRKRIHTRIGSFIALIVTAMLAYTCAEDVKYPCDERADLTFKITGTLVAECNGSQVSEQAANADIVVTHYNMTSQKIDTLLQSKLDSQGAIELIIPNSGCGISNLTVKGFYKSTTYENQIAFACCDTSLTMQFYQKCDEAVENELTCDDLDKTYSLELANQYGGCLLIGSPNSEIKWNSIAFKSDNRIQIDVSSLTSLTGKFSTTFTPNPGGSTIELAAGEELTATFLVATDETGEFAEQLTLPVTCVDGEGSGTITINLKAEVCDDGCVCPFNNSGNTEFNVDKSSDGVIVGTTTSFNNESVFTVTNNMMADGCTMQITDIQRYPNNSAPATSIPNSHQDAHAWVLTSPINYPTVLQLNDEFRISADFMPNQSGMSVDTFEVFTDIYNSVGALKDQCSFRVIMTGHGCVNACPAITINSFAPAELLSSTNTFIRNISFGETLDMDSGDKIKQKLSGNLGSDCAGLGSQPEKVVYGLNLNLNPSEEICSNIQVTVNILQDGAVDDRQFFQLSQSTLSLSAIGSESLIASFFPPSISTHLQSGHSDTYRVRIIAEASNASGMVLCTQEIQLEAEVHETAIQISEPRLMKAFSQVSDKDGSPAYQAYDIITYNELYNYFGKVDNLNPVLGHINTSATPNQPRTAHAFFFDVDEPTNKTLRQTPKLYLANNNLNVYKQVTEYPVAYYVNNDAFKNDMENLTQKVFTQGNFNSMNTVPIRNFNFSASGSDIMWTNSKNASEMTSYGSGIPLEVGGVYIVWAPEDNPHTDIPVGGDTYTNYCNVAFLYIDAINDGAGTNHHIGNVSFYVVYPLSIVKN